MNASRFKFTAIGECMVEMVPADNGLYAMRYAGDSFNTSQYLAWLDDKNDFTVSYLTSLGADKFGRKMLKAWEDNQINTDYVLTNSTKNTGLYFADTDENGNRDYTFFRSDSAAKYLFQHDDIDQTLDRVLNTSDILYVSLISMAILNNENKKKLIAFFERAHSKGIKTVLDTNYRESLWASKQETVNWHNKLLPFIHTALPTFDENQILFGDKTPKDTIDRLRQAGVKEVIVKNGKDGAYIFGNGQEIFVPAISNVKVVDTTAAGDSFNAGFLYAKTLGQSVETCAKLGHSLASKVIQHKGALISKSDVAKLSNFASDELVA